MLVKPPLQFRLRLPVAQESLPVNPGQLFEMSAGGAFTHGIEV
jgi:hypothetical protein